MKKSILFLCVLFVSVSIFGQNPTSLANGKNWEITSGANPSSGEASKITLDGSNNSSGGSVIIKSGAGIQDGDITLDSRGEVTISAQNDMLLNSYNLKTNTSSFEFKSANDSQIRSNIGKLSLFGKTALNLDSEAKINISSGYLGSLSMFGGQVNVQSVNLMNISSDKITIESAHAGIDFNMASQNVMRINYEKKVSIGTSATPTDIGSTNISHYKLFVSGGILTEEVRVQTNWADYVFDNNYQLKTLKELEDYITKNGHLPNVPSAEKVEEEGIEIGDITRIQQEKIEELTLYTIAQEKKITNQEIRNQKLETKNEESTQRINMLEARLEKLESLLLEKE